MRELLRGFLDLLLPLLCATCGEPCDATVPLCARCSASLPWLARGDDCATPKGLDACFAAVAFSGETLTWIHRFKYPRPGLRGLDPAAAAVALWLAERAAELAPAERVDLVVPVPLHPRRLRERGFNPAGLLARRIARARRARFDPVALERIRDTPSQTALDRAQRRRNVLGAFRADPRGRIPARVWLVDDVVTTGSTLTAAATALRRAGARHVTGICVARTARPGG